MGGGATGGRMVELKRLGEFPTPHSDISDSPIFRDGLGTTVELA